MDRVSPITFCAVPCPARKDACARARPGEKTAHYPGGENCPGFVPIRECSNCLSWKATEPPLGRMPGVHQTSRRCGKPRVDKSVTEWRRPTDHCDQWSEKRG